MQIRNINLEDYEIVITLRKRLDLSREEEALIGTEKRVQEAIGKISPKVPPEQNH